MRSLTDRRLYKIAHPVPCYLLRIDALARTMAQVEIPLGILTAVIGTPFFIWLLASVQKTWS